MDAHDAENQLESFLAKYEPGVAGCARAVRSALRKRFPGAFELIYDNYNALAIGFGPSERTSEAVLSIAVYPRWVSLFFLFGAFLNDPEGVLRGSGKQVRHVVLASADDLSRRAIKALLNQAIEDCPSMRKKGSPGPVLVTSVSARQRPRRPGTGTSKPRRPTAPPN